MSTTGLRQLPLTWPGCCSIIVVLPDEALTGCLIDGLNIHISIYMQLHPPTTVSDDVAYWPGYRPHIARISLTKNVKINGYT